MLLIALSLSLEICWLTDLNCPLVTLGELFLTDFFERSVSYEGEYIDPITIDFWGRSVLKGEFYNMFFKGS